MINKLGIKKLAFIPIAALLLLLSPGAALALPMLELDIDRAYGTQNVPTVNVTANNTYNSTGDMYYVSFEIDKTGLEFNCNLHFDPYSTDVTESGRSLGMDKKVRDG